MQASEWSRRIKPYSSNLLSQMGIIEIVEALLGLVLLCAIPVIVLAALKNVSRHKKGTYRYTNKGANGDFEGPLKP